MCPQRTGYHGRLPEGGGISWALWGMSVLAEMMERTAGPAGGRAEGLSEAGAGGGQIWGPDFPAEALGSREHRRTLEGS